MGIFPIGSNPWKRVWYGQMPKFRGGSDDWLDDEAEKGSAARSKMKKPSHARATALPAEEANATVAEVFPKQCRVRLDGDEREFLCAYRRAGVLRNEEIRERTFVTVGDRVRVAVLNPQSGVVEGVCERRNRLFRPAPGKEGKTVHHVIAANLDVVAIVASARNPDFSAGLVDRYLIATQAAKIEPLICVTKMDLAAAERPWKIYQDLGFQVVEVCAKQGIGTEALKARLNGKTVLFCGQSGVGKTSLLRILLDREIGRVREISEATGRGQHTTTSTVLIGGPDGSRWIDSPGVREFGLAEVAAEDLQKFYPEFAGVQCAAAACDHAGEEGCGAEGFPRHAVYRRIFESLKAGEN